MSVRPATAGISGLSLLRGAGRRARPVLQADPLASLGNDLPQAGQVLVWIVDTDGHRALPFWCSLWRFLPLSFNCYILRSICPLEGDEPAAEYRRCYIYRAVRFFSRCVLSTKYHFQTKTLGPRAAQFFTELNELRRSTFTLADVESRLDLHVYALRACRDLNGFVAFNHDR
jgi:hypothetical protein